MFVIFGTFKHLSIMDNLKSLDILKNALIMEKRGEAFYKKVAEQSDDEDVRFIFARMAQEEHMHIEFLSRQYAVFFKHHTFEIAEFPENTTTNTTDLILVEKIRKNIGCAGFEAAAISAAIDMENKAIEVYSERAVHASDPNERKLFGWLAHWEQGHHKLLYYLDNELKEKIWFDNQFWPF